jgi:radical SAM superfamily enzyme YgiQ (UPF0313 family)
MTNKVLIINVPYFVPDAVPYAPAIISGILNNHGYESKTWDINIDLYRQFYSREEWELFHKNLCVGWAGNFNQTIEPFINEILEWTANSLAKKIAECTPDIVALSIFSNQSLDFTIPLTTIIRKQLPNAYLIFGGRSLDNVEKHTGEKYSTYFINRLPVDCIYIGDAENQLVSCLDQRIQGVYIADPVTGLDLENIPKANWDGYNLSSYVGYDTKDLRLPITSSKGCIKDCTFCDVASSWPKYVFRKGKNVAEELIEIYKTTGINKFEFTDNLINGSISNFREMNTIIAEQLPNVLDYKGYAVIRGKNETLRSDIELASIAGAKTLKIGLESGSQDVRYAMKKKFTNDDLDWFAENCIDYGIQQIWLMFVGYPTETDKDFQETLNLIERYKDQIRNDQIKVWLSLPMMMTTGGAILQRYASDYGLEHILDDPWKEHFWTSTIYPDNTFEVRASRWRRFADKLNEISTGYMNQNRQAEKLIELGGLEKIYADYKTTSNKKFIPIIEGHFES